MPIRKTTSLTITLIALIGAVLMIFGRGILAEDQPIREHKENDESQISDDAARMIREGQRTFRFDTFGDESFWGDALQLHRAIAGSTLGGVGPGVSPRTAIDVGLKVDAGALPDSLIRDLSRGRVNLDDPTTTLALLKLNAVIGVKGVFNRDGDLRSVGISCAICHSTVDNRVAPGIGERLDGWANRDLNIGVIAALAPNLKPVADLLAVDEATVRKVLRSWGPGKFDAELFLDGKAFRPDNKIAANLIPAAFGLRGIDLVTYTGWGSIKYWNSFVANLEMHGKGNFFDPRLNDPAKYPIAVENHFFDVMNTPDLITPKLDALRAYQHSIDAPHPPAGSFDKSAAFRGRRIFFTKAKCDNCHRYPFYADNELHTGEELGIDNFEAMRSPTGKYRTTPLGGLFAREKGGFYHDGRFATLMDVVDHYNQHNHLNLSRREKADLVEYLKSL